ncbi:MAG: Gfo/Idh/MocA family oxidoreductase, partial [Nonomuraea sp.]|nr:Gfo/Idh/MocA family oxidoreductase [Nonomuraea sp.]
MVVAGVHGHGASHLRRLAGLGHVAELVGVCDPRPVPAEVFDGPVSPDLRALIEETRADVAVLATPIHTHEELAVAALRAGAHVLLEKPPAASLDAFERIVSAAAETGRGCQVGFQSLGSLAVPAVRELLAGIGPLRGIGVAGAWPRPAAYFTRGAWSGRRRLNGVDVVDGAVTNPFAHAVSTALAVAGTPVASVECELFHANPIESDDTSSLRILLADGTPLVVAVTLCAASREEPYVLFHGARGRVRLTYTTDEEQVDDGPVGKYGRADL